MVIVLMTNSVLYETFDDHCSFFMFNIFMNLPFILPKTYVLPFPSPIRECIEALESIHSRGTVPCATSSLQQREQCEKYFDKIHGDFHVQIILQCPVQPSTSLIERYLVIICEYTRAPQTVHNTPVMNIVKG